MNTRDKLLTSASIAGIEFIAASVSGGEEERRIVRYEAIGQDGAELEDLGKGPRVESFKAWLDEDVYQKLAAKRDEAKTVFITHPLFGSFNGRIQRVSYDADTKSGVNSTITVIEDGGPSVFGTTVISPPAANQGAKSAGQAFTDGLDDLPDSLPAGTSAAVSGASSAWSAFDAAIDDADAGGGTGWLDLGARFDELGTACEALIDSIDEAASTVTDLVDSDINDLTYSLMAACRQAVDAAQSATATVWAPFKAIDQLSVAELAREFMPDVDEDEAIDQILGSNPSILDINAIAVGMDLLIPVPS